MTVKEYLGQANYLRQSIRRMNDQILAIRTKLEGVGAIRYDKLNVQGGPEDQTAAMIDKLLEAERKSQALLAEYHATLTRLQEQIGGLDNTIYKQLLSYRYLDGLTLGMVAAKMNYSLDHAKHLHSRALRAFENKYEI